MSPKEQLAYLSQVLGFTVTYNDFPKKGEYLSLVSLSTTPPQVSPLLPFNLIGHEWMRNKFFPHPCSMPNTLHQDIWYWKALQIERKQDYYH